MTSVNCPICNDRVSGATTEDLDMNLREHFADVHRMRDLSKGARPVPMGPGREREPFREVRYEQPYEQPREREYARPRFSVPETRVERSVETWSNRDPVRFRDENRIPREEVRQWRYPVTSPTGERGPSSVQRRQRDLRESTEGPMREREHREETRTMGRGEMNPMIDCPLCGDPVRGRDEGDLSDQFRDHMADVHGISSKMMTPRMSSR